MAYWVQDSFEDGLLAANWTVAAADPTRATALADATSPHGAYCAQIELQEADDVSGLHRAELVSVEPLPVDEEAWERISVRLDAIPTDGYVSLARLKPVLTDGPSLELAVIRETDTFRFAYSSFNAAGGFIELLWTKTGIELDTWYDFVFHVQLGSPSYVELWFNQERQTLEDDSYRASVSTTETDSTQSIIGIKTAPGYTGTLIASFDNYRLSEDQIDVLDESDFSRSLYSTLAPLAENDAENNYSLRKYSIALAHMFRQTEQYVRDDVNGEPGWSALLDVDRVPRNSLSWLAQLGGVIPKQAATSGQTRRSVRLSAGRTRGTLEAMLEAGKNYLIDTKTLLYRERDTSAYHITFLSYDEETPDPTLVETALLESKPAGIQLTYDVLVGFTYLALRTDKTDYTDVVNDYADYEEVRSG